MSKMRRRGFLLALPGMALMARAIITEKPRSALLYVAKRNSGMGVHEAWEASCAKQYPPIRNYFREYYEEEFKLGDSK